MRWEDERYVRIFTRDTPTWDAMGWEAQALLMLIFRKMDRTGLLELGSSGMRGLAACVRMPIEVVSAIHAARRWERMRTTKHKQRKEQNV